MIKIYKTTEQGLEELPEMVKGCWIRAADPTPEEIRQLRDLAIPMEFITYPLDQDERARVEKGDDHTLIVLRVPVYQGPTADVPYNTMPLGIVLDSGWILTICKREYETLQEFAAGRARGLSTAKRNRFVLYLLLNTATRYLSYLREANKAVEHLEDQLQQSTRNRELLELLKYQKSLVYFTTALKSNELMMERLQRGQFFKTFPDDEDLLEDALTENQQAIEMTSIASNILSSMMDAFASIISNNMNIVMKLLTAATIIIMLPTLITSFYGMNVKLPLQEWSFTSPLIILVGLVVALVVARIFIARDWM